MCRVFVWPRLILPVPVLLKRLAAPVWVFNLGIFFSFWPGKLPNRMAGETGIPCPLEAPLSISQSAILRRFAVSTPRKAGILAEQSPLASPKLGIAARRGPKPLFDELDHSLPRIEAVPWFR
jgi:hypothetical protein